MSPPTGCLVLVVGPSGAGKDTVLHWVAERHRDDTRLVFPRRVITRPPGPGEDHVSVSVAEFERLRSGGAFALTWQAHGLHYGIPASIEADLAAGRTVVCNVSRTIIAPARTRFARVHVVEITAAPQVIAARLAARARETKAEIRERQQRNADIAPVAADTIIHNDTDIPTAAAAFEAALAAHSSARSE
jgi:ribose 1,5-bisphosphokinase